jgi:hypothetical protein
MYSNKCLEIEKKYLLDKVERGILNAASSAQWPNNEVPYVLEAVFTSADRAVIAAVSIWPSDQKHTAKRKCQKFEANIPRKEYRGLSPNFHIHVSVSELYIPTMELPFLLEEICGPFLGIYKSLTDTWV